MSEAASRVAVLNGPGLGALGRRQPEIYGSRSEADLRRLLASWAGELGLEVEYSQHDGEGDLVSAIWSSSPRCGSLVINPGGYSHTSVAVMDAMEAFPGRVVEVHISQVISREPLRRRLVTARSADVLIAGAGLEGYRLALEVIARPGGSSRA